MSNEYTFSAGPVPVTSLQGKRSVHLEGVYPDEVRAPRLMPPIRFAFYLVLKKHIVIL
jgi:hypothetical protein